MADNVNSSIDERRDYRERSQQQEARASSDVTNALITTCQPMLTTMGLLFQAYGHGLKAMAEAFEDERRHQQRRGG